MNHVYRVVFNHSIGVYQCVSELAKSRGKSSGKSQVTTKLILAPLAIAMLGLSGTAMAADLVIDNGQRNQFDQDISIDRDFLITGAGTVVAAPNNLIGFGSDPSKILTSVAINDNARVEADTITVGQFGETEVTVDNASISAGILGIGGESNSVLSITNGATLNVKTDILMGFSPISDTDFIFSTLIVDGASSTNTDNLTIARLANTRGIVTVDGTGSEFSVRNNTLVGQEGRGALYIENGGKFTSDFVSISGQTDFIESSVTVSGLESSLEVKDLLVVGGDDDGVLSINESGKVSSDQIAVGLLSDTLGRVTVSGIDSSLDSNVLTLGLEGTGSMDATNNSTVNSLNTEMGVSQGSAGVVTLDRGAQWNNKETLTVGKDGTGFIDVYGVGTRLNTDKLNIGSSNNDSSVRVSDRGTIEVDQVIVGGLDEDKADYDGYLIVVNADLEAEDINIGSYGNGALIVAGDSSNITVSNSLIIGDNGTGIVNMDRLDEEDIYSFGNNSLNVFGDTILGSSTSGNGTLNIQNEDKFQTTNLVIGGEGKGVVNINNTYDTDDHAWSTGIEVSEDIIIGNTTTGIGELNIDSAFVDAGNLIVGNEGSGVLRVVNNGFLAVNSISRGINSTLSDVYFDHADLTVEGNQSNLFANFTDKQPIKIGSNGLILDVLENDVTINPNAVLTGNVGSVDWEGVKGGFAKIGTGTLELSTNSKQWVGETLVTEGILKLNGNYVMAANDSLGIALDVENEGNLDSYGKLIVNGNADISKGELKIYASEAIKNMTGSNEWKDIVKATTRQGEFIKVSDNSPLVSFYADYSDANAVHLKIGTPPVVTPEPPVVTPEPPVVTPEPPVVTPEPPVVTPEPPVVTPEPPVVTPEPPVVTPEPPVVTPEPPVVTPEPPVVTPEPPVVTPEPPVVTPEPPVVTPEPSVGDTTFVESVTTQSQRNDTGIAYVLDKAIQDRVTNGDNTLADSLISSTVNFNQAQLATAANQLQPLFMGATNRIITDANYAATDAINNHSQTTPQRNLWAQLLGDDSSHDAENGITGYDSEGYGAIVGLDTPINSDLNLGVAFSYIKSDADTEGTSLDQELTSKNWQVLGYGNYAVSDATALNFHAGAGRSDVEGERHITILTDAIAQSDYAVDTLQAGLGVDHRIGTQQRNVTPFAQVNYARAESDSYRETGAGVYNLNVDDNTYESMRWTAGLRLSQALTPTLALTGQLAAAIENGDCRSDITASFINMPNDEFTTIGQEIGSEIGIAGIGLSYTPTINTKLSVGYRGEWRDNYDSQGANVSLQTTF